MGFLLGKIGLSRPFTPKTCSKTLTSCVPWPSRMSSSSWQPTRDPMCRMFVAVFSPGSLPIHGSLCMVKMDPTVGCQLMIWLDIAFSNGAAHRSNGRPVIFARTRRMKSRWRLFRLGSTHARVWRIKRHKL